MSALRRIGKVVGGYKVIVSCSNKPTEERVYRTYEQCNVFADEYFLDYLGVQLKCAHHPVGDGVEPEGLNPDSLETMEIEIPRDFTKENDWVHDMVVACGQNPNNSDINVVALYRIIDLIRDDERDKCASDYLQDCCDAVDAARLEEREKVLAEMQLKRSGLMGLGNQGGEK